MRRKRQTRIMVRARVKMDRIRKRKKKDMARSKPEKCDMGKEGKERERRNLRDKSDSVKGTSGGIRVA